MTIPTLNGSPRVDVFRMGVWRSLRYIGILESSLRAPSLFLEPEQRTLVPCMLKKSVSRIMLTDRAENWTGGCWIRDMPEVTEWKSR
jgi:hypothetical protein